MPSWGMSGKQLSKPPMGHFEYLVMPITLTKIPAVFQRKASTLHTLPVPGRPRSYMALDFITGLPTSRDNTIILNIIDRFPKATHFVALSKLPTALETAELLSNRVFYILCILTDITSD